MSVKNVVVELEVEYLQKAAKERGVSRAKLVRLLMRKVIAEELVSDMLVTATWPMPSRRQRNIGVFGNAKIPEESFHVGHPKNDRLL